MFKHFKLTFYLTTVFFMDFKIRNLNKDEFSFIIESAAKEGWNPGKNDGLCFYHADPKGFFIGELSGKPIGCISAVSYRDYGFIGLYIVVPEYRGKGYGLALWEKAMKRLQGHNIGLDGVKEQQANYAKSGFHFAHTNIRFEGVTSSTKISSSLQENIASADSINFSDLCEFDKELFLAERKSFLQQWISQKDTHAIIWKDNSLPSNSLGGFSVLRPCQKGYKIGPLFANNKQIATALIKNLCSKIPEGSTFYLDVPSIHEQAMSLAQDFDLTPCFETARMYTQTIPSFDPRIFGITSFELG